METSSSANPLIHKVDFMIRSSEISPGRVARAHDLIKLMQEASMQHVIKLKASAWDLKSQNITWVLLKKEVHFLQAIRMGEKIKIITFPSGFDKFFAYRDYLIFNDQRKLVATAASTWTLINQETRKLAKVPPEIANKFVLENVKFLPRISTKMAPFINGEIVDNRKIRRFDLDWNGHVNNINLCRFMLETLELTDKDRIHYFLVHFRNEATLHDELNILLKKEASESQHKIMSKDGKTEIASALCKWSTEK